MLGFILFNNGFLLSYLSTLGIGNAQILILLSLPMLTRFLLMLPFAYASDILGKEKIGIIGLFLTSDSV
jgi:hypothetical protein